MKKAFLLFLVLLIANSALAQGTRKLTWKQPANSLAEAQNFTYYYQIDQNPRSLIGPSLVTCSGTVSPYDCSFPFPAATPTVIHSISLQAANSQLESAPSPVLTFSIPAIPSQLGIL